MLKVGEQDHGNRKDGQIWALRDVNLEVKEGEILGIIGRNGAGKSTLLKILSRITAPTEGSIKIKGRVGSLLEVGTGFHPELTGKENIYLNGVILGMSRAEITSKLDEIIAFAEMEKFIDTPVKRYSSGMTVRLAFAVAAHLEPEILVIDEVLAVGDVAFQRKCLGKMEEIAGHGRTVLFVSHNMNSIETLCTKGIWMDGGTIREQGDVKEVTSSYLDSAYINESGWNCVKSEPGHERIIRDICITDDKGNEVTHIPYCDQGVVKLTYLQEANLSSHVVAIRVSDIIGNILFTSWDSDDGACKKASTGILRAFLPVKLLNPGSYKLSVLVIKTSGGRGHAVTVEEHVTKLIISAEGYVFNQGRLGIVGPLMQWTHQEVES